MRSAFARAFDEFRSHFVTVGRIDQMRQIGQMRLTAPHNTASAVAHLAL